MLNVKFKHGTWENYQCTEKDPGTLYFLDNSQIYKGDLLMQNIHAIRYTGSPSTDEHGFPITPDETMRNNFYISVENGELRYVDEDLDYINLTEIILDDILINEEFLQRLIAAIADTQNIIMPTLTVDGQKLIWTKSNVDSITVFTPKQ